MNSEAKNFYQEEAEYEQSILETKKLILKVIDIDMENFNKKIEIIDKEKKYTQFIDLLNAVLGRKTNKYYYCKNEEDTKYYDLEIGKVYRMSDLSLDLQNKYSEERVLDLQARAIVAKVLMVVTNTLKHLFKLNIQKGDGSLSTVDSSIIIEKDIEYLDNLMNYLQLMMDQTGRLKILVAERDVYAIEEAKEKYDRKSSIEKWFYKAINKEEAVIENIAKKR